MMAPDSQRVMLSLFGSVMAGTRPLGLTDSKGSAVRACVLDLLLIFLGPSWGGDGLQLALVQNAKVHELGLVGDAQLVENDGDFPWVGSLWW